ncbi:MAG: type IX secretion system periplasmic lipoprotein PorW/SprE [Bacteroidota bacterium]
MRALRNTVTASVYLILCLPVAIGISFPCQGQLGFAFDIKKPKEYDERVLRSEKSDQGKFGLPKRFIQNTVTHFNYYFNANNKLNEVLERAKEAFRDDYSRLLPFYNYTLDVTAGDSIQLDSITYKSSTGVALHDLRGDWIDNLYLLWGASFYLQKKFDSAYLMFQFINYAFAPKEKDGYYLAIGSGRDGNSALSIATKEKKSLPKKLLSEPPSRNDAFIWQIRNFLAQDQFAEAASLIVTLRDDPVFPKRLQNDLHEVQAYWFYKQNMWDSAAVHLTQALSNATNLQEKARWEYLAAQLFELGGNHKEAEKYYGKVISHTTDLILEIYARLATIRSDKDGGEKSIEKNAAELVKMAKRDKYADYQDIIYYMAAQMLLEANKVDEAMVLLQKSTRFSGSDPSQRNKAFIQLAELSLAKKQYRQAYNYYDSVNISDPAINDPNAITDLKKSLAVIATNAEIIYRQDSLQRIAAMPEDLRKDFVKQLVKTLRKQQGLKDEGPAASPFANPAANNNSLFPTNQPKGEWYFYNAASRTRGQNEFKAKWGNRPNIDNWRRSAAIIGMAGNPAGQGGNPTQQGGNLTGGSNELTYDALYANLPLTDAQLKQSNDSLQQALFALGKAYIQEMEDCPLGTETLEQLRGRFTAFQPMDEVLFNLYYCYNKNGETVKAAAIKKLMSEKYASSNLTTIVETGKNPLLTEKEVATKTYDHIYDLFIEGKFEEALTQKKAADAKYGRHYWTPQLLYIEAVYHIKQRNDSTAISVLNDIITQFAGTALAVKAQTMIDVMGRRAQIEEELRNLVVTRATDSTAGMTGVPGIYKPSTDTTAYRPPPVVVTNPPKPVKDSVVTKTNTPYSYNANEQHYVVLVLNKVDPVFVNEAKNAFIRHNRDTYYNIQYSVDLVQLDTDNRLLMIAPFANAADAVKYLDATRPRTATEIIPWLKGGKYSFVIMTDSNFSLLKTNLDVDTYKAFLNQYWPGKF